MRRARGVSKIILLKSAPAGAEQPLYLRRERFRSAERATLVTAKVAKTIAPANGAEGFPHPENRVLPGGKDSAGLSRTLLMRPVSGGGRMLPDRFATSVADV